MTGFNIRIARAFLSTTLIAAAVGLSSCGESNDKPTHSSEPTEQPTAQQGATLEQIVEAYIQATQDGKFATHLTPNLHPNAPKQSDLLKDGEPDVPTPDSAAISYQLEPLDHGEIAKLEGFMTFPIRPTHSLEFSYMRADGMKVTSPLYLTELGDGYAVATGTWKPREEIAANQASEGYSFQENDGLWKHHWDLRFGSGGDEEFALLIVESESGETVETILAPEDLNFPSGNRVLRFHLWAQGMDRISKVDSDGKTQIPYAYQAGSMGVSDAVKLPFAGIRNYEPVANPEWEDGALILARFTGMTTDRKVACVIELRSL